VPAAQVKDNAALQARPELANFQCSGRNLLIIGADQPEISRLKLIGCSDCGTGPENINRCAGTLQAAITNSTNVN